jgi:hypothetical protein
MFFGHFGSGSVAPSAGRSGAGAYARTVATTGAVFLICVTLTACAGAVIRPVVAPAQAKSEALLVLPGFGYNRDGERALQALADAAAREGMALFVPKYLSRGGLEKSRLNLERFIATHQLDRYTRVHVFAFIAGAWTLNPMVDRATLPNLATVIYDRSPYQERAPRIADDTLHFLTWLRYGSPVFDVARTPYPPLTREGVRTALLIETVPTGFIRKREAKARAYGPFRFECDTFGQRYDDCAYVPMDHEELYVNIGKLWPEVMAFIRDGRFTGAADRTPPTPPQP